MADEQNKKVEVITPRPQSSGDQSKPENAPAGAKPFATGKPNNPDDRVPVAAPPTTTRQVPVGQFGKTTTIQEEAPAKNPDGSDKLPEGAVATKDVPLASRGETADTREQAVAVTPEGHAANKPGMSAH